jgi:hypothetical protein
VDALDFPQMALQLIRLVLVVVEYGTVVEASRLWSVEMHKTGDFPLQFRHIS